MRASASQVWQSTFLSLSSRSVYHLLREWHGLPKLPYLGQQLPYIRDDPYLNRV